VALIVPKKVILIGLKKPRESRTGNSDWYMYARFLPTLKIVLPKPLYLSLVPLNFLNVCFGESLVRR